MSVCYQSSEDGGAVVGGCDVLLYVALYLVLCVLCVFCFVCYCAVKCFNCKRLKMKMSLKLNVVQCIKC